MHTTTTTITIGTMKNTTLSLSDIQTAAECADQFIAEHGDCGLPYETLMILSFVKAQCSAQSRPSSPIADAIARKVAAPAALADLSSPPAWFTEGVLQFAGRRMTASAIMSALGRPTDIKSLREAGAWLRKLYGEPLRSNGQTLFAIFAHQTGAAAVAELAGNEIDPEDAFSPALPLESRAINFAAKMQTGLYKPDEIARRVGGQGTDSEATRVGKALTQAGFRYVDGSFDLAPAT